MKHIIASGMIFAAIGLCAEFKANPDPDTLWSEDGKNISGWAKGLTFEEIREGGFSIAPGENRGYNSGRYLPACPGQAWFVCEITGVESLGGYQGFTFKNVFGITGNMQTGTFAVPFGPAAKNSFFRIDLHGIRLKLKYMKVVRKPENRIEARPDNGKIKYRVFLKSPAEDVAIRVYDGYGMPALRIGGQDKIQLRPVDEASPVEWVGESAEPAKTKGDTLLKASVLGSDTLKTPLWGKLTGKQK